MMAFYTQQKLQHERYRFRKELDQRYAVHEHARSQTTSLPIHYKKAEITFSQVNWDDEKEIGSSHQPHHVAPVWQEVIH